MSKASKSFERHQPRSSDYLEYAEWEGELFLEITRHPDPYPKRPQRCDIWFANLGTHADSHVQNGCRPVFVIGENSRYDVISVIPITSKYKRPNFPSHVWLEEVGCWRNGNYRELEPGMVLAEQVTCIDKRQLRAYVGKIKDQNAITEIERALMAHLRIEIGGTTNA